MSATDTGAPSAASERHLLVADLLMGAAYADWNLDGRELDAVRALLAQAMGRDAIPDWLEARLASFEPTRLDVVAVVRGLGLATDEERRYLLELIVAVHESDELWDFEEDDYLHKVAAALGMRRDAYADLSVDLVSVQRLGPTLLPPPLPK
jgi:uncharacterized membrane protein YebE (DUF533 family)